MVFKMVFQMVFVPNVCTVKTHGENLVKQKFTQIWNELVQHNLNLDLGTKPNKKIKNQKKTFIEYFFKN